MSSQILLEHFPAKINKSICLPASKSISNRLLILDFLSAKPFRLKNLSDADDTQLLQKLLKVVKEGKSPEIYCKNAGTVLRFLLSVLSVTHGTWILTGNERMCERPIKDLADALLQLDADLSYLSKTGFPPLQIKGKMLQGGEININPSLSSQFVSSLLLVASSLPNGLTMRLEGAVSSKPYIDMTLALLKACGIPASWENDTIAIPHSEIQALDIEIENDWSAASYFYAATALGRDYVFDIKNLLSDSLQGDRYVLPILFEKLGVQTTFNERGITLSKNNKSIDSFFEFDFTDTPDLAQTFAVCCAALGVEAKLSGLSSLLIKETDRLQALYTELKKMNAEVFMEEDTLLIKPSTLYIHQPVDTYHDHRMAMAFAPLACCFPRVLINNPEVVEKSFPRFWEEFLP